MKIERICPYCGKSFYAAESSVKHGRGKFCSRECQYKGQRTAHPVIVNCAVCGTEIRRCPAHIKSEKQFCSRECASKGRTLRLTAPIVPKKPAAFVLLKCETCGIEFKRSPYKIQHKRVFCSKECYHLSKIKPKRQKVCQTCGRSFEPWTDKQIYCSSTCFAAPRKATMRGENNPSYIDGRAKNKKCYRGDDWEDIRKAVYKRDGYRCQVCGKHCKRKEIQAHHIHPYRETFDNSLENLITLCNSCHAKTENRARGNSNTRNRPNILR